MISVSTTTLTAVADRLQLGLASSHDLGRALELSQSTLSRALRRLEQGGRVLRIGRTRGTRYALRRRVGVSSAWPIYRIDEEGHPHELGALHALVREECFVISSHERLGGLTHGLPYFLEGARPAGFMGRALPAACSGPVVPARIDQWRDDHVLAYLTLHGAGAAGDLILGETALRRHLSDARDPEVTLLPERDRSYPLLAGAALRGAPSRSPVPGEHPKFTTTLAEGGREAAVLVKFSPPVTSELGRRWADLLTAEHLAHETLTAHGVRGCASAILSHEDCVFLECERFDRIQGGGRRGVVSLFALDCAHYGMLDSWTACAARLARDGLLSTQDAERIAFLDAFGALIANNDRHLGNVSLFDRYEGVLELAPAYDMLPMLFAPCNGRVVPREFTPPTPQSAWMPVWVQAYQAARSYWERLAGDARISAPFRDLSAGCLEALRRMPGR